MGDKKENFVKTFKDKLTHAPILWLPDILKTFELECGVSGVGIDVVLIQGRHPIAYFSEKLRGVIIIYFYRFPIA